LEKLRREENLKKKISGHTSFKHIEAEVMNKKISLRFLGIILKVLRLEVSVLQVFTLQTSFIPFLLGGGGGGVK
jgi:hypothetical protein